MTNEQTFVAIIGGGITGLALGHHLRRERVPHLVLEASDRVGGVIRSARVDGSVLDWGPQRTRLTATLRHLLEEIGIADQLVTAPPDLPLFVYFAGKLRRVPFSVADFLRSDIVPFGSKLRAALEPLTRGADPAETVARYFTRKLGRRMYENVAGPLYGGLYASDPANMIVGLSLGHVLAEFGVERSLVRRFLRSGGRVAPPPPCSFEDGMEALPRALHAANRENVRLNTPALSVRQQGREWEVETEAGIIRAEKVVLSAPASAVAALLGPDCGGSADALRSLVYNPLAVVHLRAETPLRGLGYQVSFAERLVTRGVTFNASMFGRTGVYTAYLGGAKAPEVVSWSDDEIGSTAVREFREVTGHDATVLSVAREAVPAWDASWSALSNVKLPPGLFIAANWESRPGIPGRLAQAKRLADLFSLDYARDAQTA